MKRAALTLLVIIAALPAHAAVTASASGSFNFYLSALPGYEGGDPSAAVTGANLVEGFGGDNGTVTTYAHASGSVGEDASGRAAQVYTTVGSHAKATFANGVMAGAQIAAWGHTDGTTDPAPLGLSTFSGSAVFNNASLVGEPVIVIPAHTQFSVVASLMASVMLTGGAGELEYSFVTAGMTLGDQYCESSVLGSTGQSLSDADSCTLSFANNTSSSIAMYFNLGASVYGYSTVDALPVPEPASWALMLLGLGVAAGAARRRR